MSARTRSAEPPEGFEVRFSLPEPELRPSAAAALLRVLQRHAARAGSLSRNELSVDDRSEPSTADIDSRREKGTCG